MYPSQASFVLAIYGPSCVGKTTLAAAISREWGVPVRHCGDMLKTRAAELGPPLRNLPLQVHEAVDEETHRLAQGASEVFVVEGRYLNLVLDGVSQVKFVRLTCDEATRTRRFLTKAGGQGTSSITLHQSDQEDGHLRQILYGNRYFTSGDWMVLDTTHSIPEELLAYLLTRITL
jgi:cytidylate kinase